MSKSHREDDSKVREQYVKRAGDGGGLWHMRRAASESLWLAWSWGEMGMQASACILSSRKKKVLKVYVEKNHIPNYPVVYGKLRQHSGMH